MRLSGILIPMFTRPIFQNDLPPAVKEGSKLHTKNDFELHYNMFTRPNFQKNASGYYPTCAYQHVR